MVQKHQEILKFKERRRAFLVEGAPWAKVGRDERGPGWWWGMWGSGGCKGQRVASVWRQAELAAGHERPAGFADVVQSREALQSP